MTDLRHGEIGEWPRLVRCAGVLRMVPGEESMVCVRGHDHETIYDVSTERMGEALLLLGRKVVCLGWELRGLRKLVWVRPAGESIQITAPHERAARNARRWRRTLQILAEDRFTDREE